MSLKNKIRIISVIGFFFALYFIKSIQGQVMVSILFLLLSLFSSRRKEIFKFFLPFLFFSFITLFIHLFFRFDSQNYWDAFLHKPLWLKAGFFSLRNTNIILMMSYLIKSLPHLSYDQIISGLEDHISSRFAQPLSIAVYYSALLQDEFRSLQQVHRILGIKKPTALAAKLKYYISLILPTILASLEKAENLSIAMTSRGYNQEISV